MQKRLHINCKVVIIKLIRLAKEKIMQEGFIEDLQKGLLLSNSIGQEEALDIYDALVKKYKKVRNLGLGKKAEEGESEEFKKVIKSLPKYAKYYDIDGFDVCLSEYKNSLPREIKFDEKDLKGSIASLAETVISVQASIGKFSRNSGVNIANDKTNYTNSVVDFETASNPQFVESLIAKVGSSNPEVVAQCKKRCDDLCKSLAESAIEDKTSYYDRYVDYLVDFYSDNEIARQGEPQMA